MSVYGVLEADRAVSTRPVLAIVIRINQNTAMRNAINTEYFLGTKFPEIEQTKSLFFFCMQ